MTKNEKFLKKEKRQPKAQLSLTVLSGDKCFASGGPVTDMVKGETLLWKWIDIRIFTKDISYISNAEFVHWLKERSLRKSVCFICRKRHETPCSMNVNLRFTNKEEKGESYSVWCEMDIVFQSRKLSLILSRQTLFTNKAFPINLWQGFSLITNEIWDLHWDLHIKFVTILECKKMYLLQNCCRFGQCLRASVTSVTLNLENKNKYLIHYSCWIYWPRCCLFPIVCFRKFKCLVKNWKGFWVPKH